MEPTTPMTPEAIEARRLYHRTYAKKNPDKIKAAQARYWERRAQKLKAEQNETPQEESPNEQ